MIVAILIYYVFAFTIIALAIYHAVRLNRRDANAAFAEANAVLDAWHQELSDALSNDQKLKLSVDSYIANPQPNEYSLSPSSEDAFVSFVQRHESLQE